MINTLRHLGLLGVAAACVVSPAAAQYHAWSHSRGPCGCGDYAPSPPPRASAYHYYQQQHYVDERPYEPSSIVRNTPVRAPSRQPPQYYTPDEERVLFHPVVVPLDEFLRPGLPVALSPDQLARQRAAAEKRATLLLPPQGTAPVVGTPQSDPFADDPPAPRETADAASESTPAVAAEEPVEPADEDASFEETMSAEQPEAEAAPDAEAPPATEPAEADPFESFE